MSLILASASPRRRQLLAMVTAHPFEVSAPDTPETLLPEWTPRQAVEALSREKALALGGPDDVIVAADTLVHFGGALLGKPRDEDEAFFMLKTLAGQTHTVFTGVTVRREHKLLTGCSMADVTFRPLDDGEIRRYIATGEPMDKAGAYGINGPGALFVSRVCGDYYAVVGLPLCLLGEMLRDFGVTLV